MSLSKCKILFQLSGSIAAYKACFAISRLIQEGNQVQVACSKGALEFVGEATLEGLSGKPVFKDLYERGRMMDHIHLAQWADVSILAPASASAIARLAHGDANDVIGALYLAFERKKPYLLAPAMNQMMIQHPAVEENLRILAQRGVIVLGTATGRQACGDIGPGRMLEPEALVNSIHRALSGDSQ